MRKFINGGVATNHVHTSQHTAHQKLLNFLFFVVIFDTGRVLDYCISFLSSLIISFEEYLLVETVL